MYVFKPAILMTLILTFGSLACTKDSTSKKKEAEMPELHAQWSQTTWHSGTVIDARGLDGCDFLIKLSADNSQLQPINLDDSYKTDGLEVEFKAELAEDMMSICMAGPMINILDIRRPS